MDSGKNTTGDIKPAKGVANLTLSATIFHNIDMDNL